jgi:serine/threonine protein phosphatase PrpC
MAQRLSFDHKPGDPAEKARIEVCGGSVLWIRDIARLDGYLAVARSFGDLSFAPKVSVEPHTCTVPLEATDQFLILACDGVWDVLSDQDATDLAGRILSRGATAVLASERLRDEAYTRGSTDNISVMVILLGPVEQNATEVVGTFSTTQNGKLGIQFGDDWPRIKEIKAKSLAAEQPQLQLGMQLLSINGQSVEGLEFKKAAAMVKMRPLELVFSV